MRLNFRKIKHLYFIYGFLNTSVIVVTLLIAYLLYHEHAELERFNQKISRELINTYNYRTLAAEFANKNVLQADFFQQAENHQTIDFIQQLNTSKLNILDIKKKNSIHDIHFNENIQGLIIDYEDLQTEIVLLFNYLQEFGNSSNGLYFKLEIAAGDFKKKLGEYKASSDLMEDFIYLESLIGLFFNTRNETLVNSINPEIINLKNKIKAINPRGNNYMATRIADAFLNFEDSYYEFAKKAFEIGIVETKGLQAKIGNRYKKIESRLWKIAEIIASEKQQTQNTVIFSIVVIVLIVIGSNIGASYFFINNFNQFTSEINQHIKSLSSGILTKIDRSKAPQETFDLLNGIESFSQKLINGSSTATSFANGNINVDIKKEEQFNVFYSAFTKIKQNFESQNQKVREEKKKQTNMLWIKSGLDKLTEVMRHEYDNPLLHANEIISMLVKFLNIPIGAIYHFKEEDGKKYVELMASFAYGKEKQLYKKIAFGEGIVGTSASEKKTLNITNIPEGHFRIISGFGETNPKNMLVSPIKLNEEIFGVVELASLTRFKQEEIDFVEEFCKTVAFSFAISKVYLNTLNKFDNSNMEIAQLESENASLTNDYEDLNNNYRKLTQKGADNSFIVDRLNGIALVIDLDLDGNILDVNLAFEKFFKSAKIKFLQTNFREYIMDINLSDDIDFEYVWREARSGIQHEINQKLMVLNNEVWLNQHYFPVKDEKGRVKKIKVIAFDLTDKIKLNQELTNI